MALVPPVDKDGFSYAGDSLFREASNLNRHRRATIPELKAHFAGKDTENRPAHWYEAQLLHYGLPPSKVKGTAHKRRKLPAGCGSNRLLQLLCTQFSQELVSETIATALGLQSYATQEFIAKLTLYAQVFDAVMAKGGLRVPTHIQKIEADLKKEWNKREKEAKKVLKGSEGKGTKRKADQVSTNVNFNVSVQVTSTGAVQVQAAQPTKRPKKSGSTTKSEKVDPVPKAVKAAEKKAMAKKPAQKPAQKPRPPKSGTAQASAYTTGGPSQGYDDAPPPYFEVDPGHGPAFQYSPRRGIGLLNGRYEVDCPHMEGNFPEYRNDFGLIATLDGTKLWLKFDLGPLVGIMKVDRPYEVDEDEQGTMLLWRGDCTFDEQDIHIDTFGRAGEANRLYFLGGGHIRGTIAYDLHEIDFDAYRIPGQSMTSEITPSQARAEWARRG